MSKFLEGLVRSKGKSCDGKIRYPSEESAMRNAEAMMAKKGNGEIFESYLCAYCEGYGWHIGHRTNFDWIPKSHMGQRVMLNKYTCPCGFGWITTTVFSTRILSHFPSVIDAAEECLKCPKCKSTELQSMCYGAACEECVQGIRWIARKWANLELIDPNTQFSVEQLWDLAVDTTE